MYRFEVRELVVVRVDADAEEEAGVATVDDLVVAELEQYLNIDPMLTLWARTSTKFDWYF